MGVKGKEDGKGGGHGEQTREKGGEKRGGVGEEGGEESYLRIDLYFDINLPKVFINFLF